MVEYRKQAKKKAELLLHNTLYVPSSVRLPFPYERSTAGPSTGTKSLTLQFNTSQVKLQVTSNPNEVFSLKQATHDFCILKNNNLFLSHVKILPVWFHAPNQIFLNLEDRCIYNCAFCALAQKIDGHLHKKYTKERFVHVITQGITKHQLQSVALTSGIYPSNTKIIEKMTYIIQTIKQRYPEVSMGVEPCIFTVDELISLKNAGADELKLNIQIPDKSLFTDICPDFIYDTILYLLQEAVKLFGKGKVTSNIIFGLGETDKGIIECIEQLSQIGVVPTLRKIQVHEYNKNKLEERISTPLPSVSVEQIMKLAKKQKEILNRYGLTTQSFKTMCHACGCCDLVPFKDI